MLNKIFAFVGGGNMATTMINGILKAGVTPSKLRVSDPEDYRRQVLFDQFTVPVFESNREAVQGAEVVIIAVKPHQVRAVIAEIAPGLSSEAVVISIAAGVTLEHLRQGLPPNQPVARVMPNTPALIGAGISAIYPAPELAARQLALVKQVMESIGVAVVITSEAQMDAVTALSGSGPAYVFMIAEALSDGGVACGLPRELADQLAVQTLIGSARMIAETRQHPGVLKNQVTSPGGTTIAAVLELEQAGVRGALMKAVIAAWRRSRELGEG